MVIDLQQLPDDPAQLKRIIVELLTQMRKAEAGQEQARQMLREWIEARRHRSSEKLSGDQLALFAAAWQAQQPEQTQAEDGGSSPDDDLPPPPPPASGSADQPPPRRSGRPALPRHLKRERKVHDVAGKDQPCPDCGQALEPMGQDSSEHYEYVPAQLKVIEDVCLKYKCECTIHTATKPAQPLPKSNADASLLAWIVTAKFLYHLPLNRQQQMWDAQGVELSRKTTSGWLANLALLTGPLYEVLKIHVFSSKVLGTDDTSVKVLDRELDFARTGRLWPHCGDAEHPGVIFNYTKTRGAAGALAFLAGFRGYLQADAYSVYDQLFKLPARGVIEVGCWAHARRYLLKAVDSAKDFAGPALWLVNRLYQVEERARDATAELRRALRQQFARPLLDKIQGHLDRFRFEVLPKSPAADAIRYLTNQWEALNRYCEDGDLSIDNNATERSLRRVAVGRRNWMFFGSDVGGQTAAVLLSFVASCRLVGVDVYTWFRDVLTRIAQGHPVNRLAELLPHCWKPLAA